MIEIKCSKAQFKRILTSLTESGMLFDNRCVLGKTSATCPAVNGSKPKLTCKDCLKKNIKRVEDAPIEDELPICGDCLCRVCANSNCLGCEDCQGVVETEDDCVQEFVSYGDD